MLGTPSHPLRRDATLSRLGDVACHVSTASGVRDGFVEGEKIKKRTNQGLHQLWNRRSFRIMPNQRDAQAQAAGPPTPVKEPLFHLNYCSNAAVFFLTGLLLGTSSSITTFFGRWAEEDGTGEEEPGALILGSSEAAVC